jgi:hypothetical protein
MNDLLGMSTAIISPCELYRYELRRIWDFGKPQLVVCMLNPSTADAEKNDMTISTLIRFATLWGYGGILVVNFCAFRASKPKDMWKAKDPAGPENHDYVRAALRYASENGGRALAAWGAVEHVDSVFMREAEIWKVELLCLGLTKGGNPKHPAARGTHRIPRDQQPIVWRTFA